MLRPTARRAVRTTTMAAAGLLALAVVLPLPGAAQPAPPPEPARELADALSLPPLALGVPVAVRLNRGQAAFFRLPENVGDIAALTRRLARDTDTVLALYDSHGRLLEEDDDGGDEMLASRIDISATQRGPLILRASLLDGGAGRFEVMLEAAPARAADAPPRTLAEAAGRPGLTVGEPLRLTLRGRQEAYVALPADAPDLIAVTRGLSPGTDTVLTLVDANGRELASDDDGGEEQLASRLEIPAAQRRPLFLRIGTLGGGGGTFDVVIQPDAPAATPTFPRSMREATAAPALTVGQTVPLRLRRGQSALFRLPEGDIAVVTRNLGRGVDTVLTLLDAEGQEMSEDDDGGGGLASRLEIGAGEARPIFVRIRLLGDSAGTFELAVEADTPQAVTFPTSLEAAAAAPMLQPGQAVSIRLRRGQSAFFMLPAGQQVVMTRDLRDGTDTVLEILDPNGRMLAEDDDGGGGFASRIEVAEVGKGPLFVRAGILGDTGGQFELVLTPR
ncbi:hypothetical protein GXW78_24935 [Roseomonas terrae]|uniref:Uncharacterized protein n=1 Tax=Neoroseomonas terrae TaxID=424799 RepID=A0ABS5EPF6_9PROT|nr:hypothetical protein [Neoroseomonas terrae]MBR0652924.1 hypothetical protein [Neoroseomonas terrae]